MGDGAGQLAGVCDGGGAGDVEGDDVAYAFSVVDDLVGEGLTDEGKGIVEGLGEWWGELDAAGSAGEEEDGVVGGGVAVDGDDVEAGFDGGGEGGAELGGVCDDVGEEVDEHGGVGWEPGLDGWAELGVDHACALGGTEEADLCAFDVDDGSGDLHAGVCGEDGRGEGFGVGWRLAEGGGDVRHGGEDFGGGEWDADDAGGGREDLVEDAAEGLGGGDAGLAAGVDAGFAGGAVGVAGVDEDDGDSASGGLEVVSADGDRGGDHLVPGEHGGCGGAPGGESYGEVGVAAGLDAGPNGPPEEAARQFGRRWRELVDLQARFHWITQERGNRLREAARGERRDARSGHTVEG